MNIRENVSLKKYNTFGIDAYTKYFIEIDSADTAAEFLDDKKYRPIPRFILGGGSNVLFTKNIDGMVVKNSIRGIELLREDSEHLYLKAGAGESWHGFVMHCVEKNYAGIENLSLIPGQVGAAPIQNIGAYGVEQKEVFYELEAIDLYENKKAVFKNSDCEFGYRNSIFKNKAKGQYIITSVTFCLDKTPKFNTSYGAISQELERMGSRLSVAAISKAVCNIRRSKLPDPEKTGNAGSFFKNPSVSKEKYDELKKNNPSIVAYPPSSSSAKDRGAWKLAAGWLIEQCGWKGKQIGNAGVHKDQALVLVNFGNASGMEIFELSEKILQSVKKKFEIELEREVVVL